MIYAMFAMILLTFAVALHMFKLRVTAVKKGEVKISQFRLSSDKDIPDKLVQASRNYANLFEMPVLFYAGCTLTLALQLENAVVIILSWVFVVSRVVHSWIHLTNNNVLHRMKAFMVGNICVLVIWAMLVLQYAANQP